jgi:tRNA(His) guanylyltransferase
VVDKLGDRIKRYEAVSNTLLTRRTPVVIRVDGKAFHTWTKGMGRPYDTRLSYAMVGAAVRTAKSMQGFRGGYVQSDEATFVLADFDTLETEAWYGYEVSKLTSITASLFTGHFNQCISNRVGTPAAFDARAFNVPLDDVPNALLWRQFDWERNSIQMLGRAHFSQRQMQNASNLDIYHMLKRKGIDPDTARTDRDKWGTWLARDGRNILEKLDYDRVRRILFPELYP